MLTIFIDNKPYQVEEGQNLLQACLSLGFDLPYFCWHPALHSVGACRQCAVKQFKDDKDARGRIVMSCMTPVAEGLRISIDDPDVKAFRASIIEWLMVSHPHDCPICDEGGECHLQDVTVMTGHNYRRTRFKKRTHRNQNLGPFINHEMNRCIACYRCVRFYRDYAGCRDLNVFASHDHVYFGRHEDGVLESAFSGNLVEICPTGVFTDKTLKQHYTRKWDLQTAPSICVHCSLGCNTIPGERYGMLRRMLNRYNHEVNGYFLCDRGRFGYEFVNSGRRIRKPLLRNVRQTEQIPVARETAFNHLINILSHSKGLIGIGSPRASLEANFALRMLVGADRFYSGLFAKEHNLISLIVDILQKSPSRTPSLHDVEGADAVLVLGEDLTNTAPLLDLALRQSVRNKPKERAEKIRIPAWDDNAVRNVTQDVTGPLFIASASGTKLDAIATKTYHAAPDTIARLGFAVAHEVDPTSPAVPNLDNGTLKFAQEIAEALKNAKSPLIISGTSLCSEAIVQASANVAWALYNGGKASGLCFAVSECNTIGLGLMNGKQLDDAFNVIQEEQADTVIILENDLFRRADQKAVHQFLSKSQYVIVLDHLINATSSKADIVLPAGTFAESDGSLVNNEGRAQRHYQVCMPNHDIQESWKWLRDIIKASGQSIAEQWNNLDEITQGMLSVLPVLKPLQGIAPTADFRIAGQKIPRQPHRYSGRTSMLANISVHEPKPPDDPDSPLSFSMEGCESSPPAPLISRYWVPGWNSVQALNKFQQEVGGILRGGDPGKRLIEPSRKEVAFYYMQVPEIFRPKQGEWLMLPLYDIFGSEELSILSPGIVERAPKPFIALNPVDAARLNVSNGELIELSHAGDKYRFELKIKPEIPEGTAGLYSSLPFSSTMSSTYCKIVKV
ncbi:MAG TPA: NADH-quinone oxidoreductase subunit NuoG [Nitrospirota bacterium]|nr:NADH-quinone oxidoreductase subunit NuoG [Nitrospirota bacterium]